MMKETQRYIITGCFILLLVVGCQATVCEDIEADCARLDIERNICSDPLESSVYCTKYCGHCAGPVVVVPLCEDNDRSCRTLASTSYCSQEQGRQMCPKSCNSCKKSHAGDTRGDTSVISKNEAMKAGSKVNQTSSSAAEILDPACQDIDHGCFFHLHECYSSMLIRMMCQRSCHLCPSDPSLGVVHNVPETLAANSDAVSIKLLTLTKFDPTPDNCVDHDSQCADLVMTYQCQTDLFLPRLCPDACGLCSE
ncbi:hypothetical protein Btru_025527 [Bulinus truncatus]|nr:hypothetical protein Btru_025527 [Bulinus truncatus]